MAESTHSMSDWDSPDVQTWMEEAKAHQQHMYLRLGDREWDKSDTTILPRKVGFAMFSQPGNLPEKNNNFTGYGQTQLEEIKRAADVILERAEDDSTIDFACIFVFRKIGEERFKIPVFIVKGTQNQTLFVDLNCCVYENWRDYLYSNCLPKSMYCYPLDGLYHGNEGLLQLDFGSDTPTVYHFLKNNDFDLELVCKLANRHSYGKLKLLNPRGDRLVTYSPIRRISDPIPRVESSNAIDQRLIDLDCSVLPLNADLDNGAGTGMAAVIPISPQEESIEELILLLTDLKNAKFTPHSEYLKTMFLVDEVLYYFFEIEVTKTKFRSSDRDKIGPLIGKSLSAIGSWVSFSFGLIHEGRVEDYKIERSGLQFLLDQYQEFPDGRNGSLKYALEIFKDKEDIEGWDKKFENVNNSYDPYFCYETSDEPTLTAEEKEQVPKSHWWWW